MFFTLYNWKLVIIILWISPNNTLFGDETIFLLGNVKIKRENRNMWTLKRISLFSNAVLLWLITSSFSMFVCFAKMKHALVYETCSCVQIKFIQLIFHSNLNSCLTKQAYNVDIIVDPLFTAKTIIKPLGVLVIFSVNADPEKS